MPVLVAHSGANGEYVNIPHKCINTEVSLHARSQRSRVELDWFTSGNFLYRLHVQLKPPDRSFRELYSSP